MEAVISVYGPGGPGEGGLSDAFGGAAIYKNDETGMCFFGIWGARNAAKFRADLETKLNIEVVKEAPPARLSRWARLGTGTRHCFLRVQDPTAGASLAFPCIERRR
ncbi:hypothetical protein A6U87_09390 [Rhizobium sp. AC44/96]|nr:hypothetical protein A6U87_09390 [Rhizobium sp. AC44/96]